MTNQDSPDLSPRAVIELIDRINLMNRELTTEITNTHRALAGEISRTNQNVAVLVADIKDLAVDIHDSIAHSDEVRKSLLALDGRVSSLEMRILTEDEHRDVRVLVDEWKNRRAVMTQVQAHTEGSTWDRRLALISIMFTTIYAAIAILSYVHSL